jgi:dephospho-CoA kinase
MDGCCLQRKDLEMFVAGLTGGIASGKSTVAAIFKEAGAYIIDADQIAREAVHRESPAYRDIVSRFGRSLVLDDGQIDRKRLGAIIFNDPVERRALENIVHPQVKKEISLRLDRVRRDAPGAVVLVDVPLLFETGMDRNYQAALVVYLPERLQLTRLMTRDGINETDALVRIRSQMPIEKKKSLATHVIDNSGSIENTRSQALEIYRQFASKGLAPEKHEANG